MRMCPRCRLLNPDDSPKCDCGFDLTSGAALPGNHGIPILGIAGKAVRSVVALAIAAAAGATGARILPEAPLHLVPASIITWILLLPVVARGNVLLTIGVGILSPFLGAFVLALISQEYGDTTNIHGFSGVMIYAGVTALLIRWVMGQRKVKIRSAV
jgi:hypothetical protein